jgi:hypothetical protein
MQDARKYTASQKMVTKNKAGLFTGKKENNTSWTFSLTAIQ